MKKHQSPSIITLTTTLLLVLLSNLRVEGTRKTYGVADSGSGNNNVKLFVFGDSYVDTENAVHSKAYSWPYGISSYPDHRPTGRNSDGKVFTDYIANYLNMTAPIPNAFRNESNIQNGINFAFGGTGVYDTHIDGPNLTAQINSFEQLIQQKLFTKEDLQNSVVLVNAGANDYSKHFQDRKFFDIPKFISRLVNQLTTELKRFPSLGVGKVLVVLLQPVGCLPLVTFIDFHLVCIDLVNKISESHNKQLNNAIGQLKAETTGTNFVTLDLYKAMLQFLEEMMMKARNGNSSVSNAYWNPLRECCEPNLGHECGDVDDDNNPLYKVCDNPGAAFFWDQAHPSETGWSIIFAILRPSLHQLTQH
ncbi:hypothetical protein PIB30_014537 [Stylosanthes scabra]|uniref:GDSL esterase/lipase n=1 Tax=Stylosanthes scabra TaxID=79078 RepID=A0ABU6Y566_9FABA|nr:hypothetical protein [Stylosanthes scabra]